MDPISATIVIAGIVIDVLRSLDSSIGLALNSKRNARLQKDAMKIAKDIMKDQELANNLLDAYNRKDNQLQSELLMSSPFGSRLSILRSSIHKNKEAINQTKAQISDLNRRQAALNDKLNTEQTKRQTSGSAIVDLISGAARKPSTSFAEENKYESQAKELQNKLEGVK